LLLLAVIARIIKRNRPQPGELYLVQNKETGRYFAGRQVERVGLPGGGQAEGRFNKWVFSRPQAVPVEAGSPDFLAFWRHKDIFKFIKL